MEVTMNNNFYTIPESWYKQFDNKFISNKTESIYIFFKKRYTLIGTKQKGILILG